MRSQQSTSVHQDWHTTRRTVLKASVASLLNVTMGSCLSQARAESRPNTSRFGIVTDPHYTHRNYGSRYCDQSLDKMAECVELMNKQAVDFLVELGDFKDQDDPPDGRTTLSYLQAIEAEFKRFNGPTYHVLGNHDMDSISKSQFLTNVQNTDIAPELSYYSFDVNGLHFVVLDANYTSAGIDYDHGHFDWTDANIPALELEWLEQDLASAKGPVIIMIHQLLDGTGSHYVKNAADVRRILGLSGKVMAVFQGHYHTGSYNEIQGIHYYTLKAMVEGTGVRNSAYAIVDVHADRSITVSAYRQATRREFPARCSIADLNGDCVVDFKDAAILAENWLDKGLVVTPPGRPHR